MTSMTTSFIHCATNSLCHNETVAALAIRSQEQPRATRISLDTRFCDLNLSVRGTQLEQRVARLYSELASQGIRFRPHVWLSTEWFSPDGVPGIALPFYLADPRLTALERRMVGEVEGMSETEGMKLLRHEMGHVVCTAFRLHYKPSWRQVFGRFGAPYPNVYRPDQSSRDYVLHLDDWYAQAHPAEDFAETFAVWLGRPKRWRREYRGWPALRKLEYVDRLMREHVCGQRPKVTSRRQVEPLRENRTSLRAYYAAKTEHYAKSGQGQFAF